jgi:hypothetical protein
VPASAARGLGVGRDHRDARLGQVVPVLDSLRVALADEKHDRRGVRGAVVGETLLPVRRQQLAVGGDRVDVAGERERQDVGLQAVDHAAGLLAGAAVGLLDVHVLARDRLPVLGECRVVLDVEFPRRVV